jgi:RHS repeat-associated protein
VDARTYQNGVVADYTYDANNRITSLTHNHGATLVAGFTHQYDDERNKKNEEKLHQTGASEAYAYDSIYRLVDYKVGPLVAGTVPVPVTQTAYNLDAVGNWNSKTTDSTVQTRMHNAANEITAIDSTSITHDHNGNLIQDANYDYTFDENNRLIGVAQASVPVASYAYDAMGRRISKTAGPIVTVFYYDNARIIESQETGGSGSVTTYTYGNYIDEVLTLTSSLLPLSPYFYHQNTLWSVHALTDATGTVVERYTYDAYGTITVLDPSFLPLTSSPLAYFTFTGREYDDETSIYHYRARSYDSFKGRFLTRDPLEYVDGMNLYEYVKSAVTQYMDPLGAFTVTNMDDPPLTGIANSGWSYRYRFNGEPNELIVQSITTSIVLESHGVVKCEVYMEFAEAFLLSHGPTIGRATDFHTVNLVDFMTACQCVGNCTGDQIIVKQKGDVKKHATLSTGIHSLPLVTNLGITSRFGYINYPGYNIEATIEDVMGFRPLGHPMSPLPTLVTASASGGITIGAFNHESTASFIGLHLSDGTQVPVITMPPNRDYLLWD